MNLILDACPKNGNYSEDATNKSIYQKIIAFDKKQFNISSSPLAKTKPNLAGDIPRLNINIFNKNKSRQVALAQLNDIKAYRLDLILAFGKGPLITQLANCAKYGIWTHEISESGHPLTLNCGFQEMINQQPIVNSGLYAFTGDNKVHNLYTSSSSTEGISLHRLFNRVYWKMPSFFHRVTRNLMEIGNETFIQSYFNPSKNQVAAYVNKPKPLPLFDLFIRYFKNFIIAKVKNKINKEKWIMLFSLERQNIDPTNLALSSFTKIKPPKGEFWADPFIIHHDKKYHVYFEACNVKSRSKGNISLITIDSSGTVSKPRIILKKRYHLSYPYLFEWENEWYMIPETAENKTIDLYKCVKFPDQWEFQHSIMQNINAVDSTLLFFENRWWLFVNLKEQEGSSSWDELFLFFADDPMSKSWQSHPQNPVVSDVTSARPAGKIMLKDNKLYRPSQNSSYYYGYGMKINEIKVINEREYVEEEVKSYIPDWDPKLKAIHTLNIKDDLAIIDAIWKDKVHY